MSVCNVCIFPSLAYAGFEDFLAVRLFLHPFMAYLKDSAWVFFEKSSFAFPPPPLPPKKIVFTTLCAGFEVFKVVLLLSNSIYGLFERLYIGHIFLE